MDTPDQGYWSVEDCRWVRLPAREGLSAETDTDLPPQREGEPGKEPVEA